ncbi:unnamed protein product, partial [marine sediment metagenome]
DNLIKSRFDNFAKDGKYYGIDYHVGATVMYYNTEILGQAGVNVDDIITARTNGNGINMNIVKNVYLKLTLNAL